MTMKYAPAGQCIYCGSTEDLSDEHIIPFALGGQLILPDASCAACAAITSKLELRVLRGPLWASRTAMGLPTRRRKSRPESFPLPVTRGGSEGIEDIDVETHPASLMLPLFDPPPALTADAPVEAPAVQAIYIGLRRPREDVAASLGAEGYSEEIVYSFVEFARMIGKIAYSYAAAEVGIDGLGARRPLAAILGQQADIGTWVGGGGVELADGCGPDGPPHRLALWQGSGALAVTVQLFCHDPSPAYAVVIDQPG